MTASPKGLPGFVAYTVKINGKTMTDFIWDAQVRQGWGSHDMVFLRILMPKDHSFAWRLKPWPDGAAVEILWGRTPQYTTWYGYVNHHEQSTEDDNGVHTTQITYVCIGTSKRMNSDRGRIWQGVTPTYIARRIAREHGLRAVLTSTTWRLDHEAQALESDFRFLCRLADKTGYRFWVGGGTLYFVDPLAVLAGTRNFFVPKYRIDKTPAVQDTAVDFQVSQGDNLPGAVRGTRTMYGFDPGSKGLYRATAAGSSGPVEIATTTRSPKSLWEARRFLDATQARAQFWLGGTVKLFGYPLLYPGKVIEIDGLRLPGQKSGYWIVTGSQHYLKRSGLPDPATDRYETHVSVITNTTSYTPAVRGVQRVRPETVRCELTGGNQWRSTDLSVLYEDAV